MPVSWLNDMIGLTLPVTDGFDQRQLGPLPTIFSIRHVTPSALRCRWVVKV